MHGYLVIADISGYTQFLTESEFDHANGVVGDLLNSIITAIQAPLSVSSIEGDAVFMYGELIDGMHGQTVLESVELLYCSFASALETMVINTTCTCNACVNISSLGLKIVMHCGEFAKVEAGGMTSLSGPDVIAVHRLLKNHVIETTGIDDYLLVTQRCVDELGVDGLVAAWTPHTEEYEHIGVVDGYVSSLRDVYTYQQRQKEIKVPEADAWYSVRGATVAPPAVVWDLIIDPRKRLEWVTIAVDMDLEGMVDGRVAPGSEYHCFHGDGSKAVFTVLDMRPYEYITVMVDFADGTIVRYTFYLVPSGSGTRIFMHAAAPTDPDGTPRPDVAGPESVEAWAGVVDANMAALTSMADGVAATLQSA